MQILPNDLEHEFPEFAGLMHQLRAHDPKLDKLIEQYDKVNRAIVDIEERRRPFEDASFEKMKKERLRVKDEIYRTLLAHER